MSTSSARYAVRKKIADGGMAEIFLADLQGAEGFARPVVLKRILPALSAQPELRGLLIDEAHLAMTLIHGNIVQVLDLGRAGAQFFLVLELVDGWNLATLLSRAEAAQVPLPPGVALHIMAQLCRGLAYAHTRQVDGRPATVIHRDVCPPNVLVSQHGEVKVADFGIARAVNQSHRARANFAGMVVGHLGFMAPEQARGENVDARADVFGAGAVLYALVTGRAPLQADDDREALLLAQTGVFTPPERLNPDLAPPVARIIKKAMAVRAADRYETAAPLMEDVETVARSHFGAPGQSALIEWLARLHARDGRPAISGTPGLPLRGDTPLPLAPDQTIALDDRAVIEVRLGDDLLAPPQPGFAGTPAVAAEAPTPALTPAAGPHRRVWLFSAVLVAALAVLALTASRPGGLTASLSGFLAALRERFSAPETAPTTERGSVRIESEPPDAEVWRNGELIGRTPLSLSARVGSVHTLVFRLPGSADVTHAVTVPPGTSGVKVKLRAADSGVAP